MPDANAVTPPLAVLIWWLTQEEWEAAAIRDMDGIPAYVREEFTKCQGFPSRARLWVSDALAIALPEDAAWMDAGPRAEGEAATSGIVLREEDGPSLKGWPGRVTDTAMQPVHQTQEPLRP